MKPGDIVRSWRRMRELSQSAVADAANISVRHLSFVETGRTRASAEVLKTLANVIVIPRGEYDRLMLTAGYAPESDDAPYVTDAVAAPFRARLAERVTLTSKTVVSGFGDIPAVALDETWTIVEENKAHATLIGALSSLKRGSCPNYMRLLFHPNGIGRRIEQWPHLSAVLMLMLRKQAVGKHHSDPIHRLIDEISVWADDRDGKEITEPYDFSALAARADFSTERGGKSSFHITMLGFAAPYSPKLKDRRFVVYYPADLDQ